MPISRRPLASLPSPFVALLPSVSSGAAGGGGAALRSTRRITRPIPTDGTFEPGPSSLSRRCVHLRCIDTWGVSNQKCTKKTAASKQCSQCMLRKTVALTRSVRRQPKGLTERLDQKEDYDLTKRRIITCAPSLNHTPCDKPLRSRRLCSICGLRVAWMNWKRLALARLQKRLSFSTRRREEQLDCAHGAAPSQQCMK